MKIFIKGKSINLREVNLDDAEFILSLRQDEKLNKFLKKVDNDIEKQKNYIKNYKNNEQDSYFVIEGKDKEKYGTIRFININKEYFEGASFVVSRKAPYFAGIEAYLLFCDYGFFGQKKVKLLKNVKKQNIKVYNFYRRTGSTITNEDKEYYYFCCGIETYKKFRERCKRYVLVDIRKIS